MSRPERLSVNQFKTLPSWKDIHPEIHLELPTAGQCNLPFRDGEQEMATRLEN